MSLKGRKAVVAGAAGAVGVELLRRFVSEGMTVAGIARGIPDRPVDRVRYFTADLADETSVAKAFDAAQSALGGIEILVNAVGGYLPGKPVAELAFETWNATFQRNLFTVFLCTREGLRRMGNTYGRIINFSAMSAFRPSGGRSAYAIAKAGVAMLTEIAAKEAAGTGITVNAIAPGIIATEGNRMSMPDDDQRTWVTPQQIVDAVLTICRDESAAINGTTLRLFGGL